MYGYIHGFSGLLYGEASIWGLIFVFLVRVSGDHDTTVLHLVFFMPKGKGRMGAMETRWRYRFTL